MNTKFVYLIQDIEIDNYIINKNEVGIIEDSNNINSKIKFINLNLTVIIDNNLFKEFESDKTGDQFDKKICNICNKLLPIEMFEKNQNGKNNRIVRRPSCINCRKIIDGINVSAKDKNRMQKIKPYKTFWECPICKKKTIPGVTSKVVLDHNHKTGQPRAWICDSCNTGLGRFKDDISIIENAINYLKQFND